EAKLVRDLLFALQGVTSATSKGESFEIDTVLSRPAWLLCQRVLEIARLHLRLSAAAKVWRVSHRLESAPARHHELVCSAAKSDKCNAQHAQPLLTQDTGGLLHQALCEALRGQLQDYYEVLALLSAEGATQMTQMPQIPSISLGEIASSEVALEPELFSLGIFEFRLFGGALASLVYAFSHSGDTAVRDSAHRILRLALGRPV
ncbi:unnamed protein product, partial [Effrenium voratum]